MTATLALASILWHRHFYVDSGNAVLQAYFEPLSPQVEGEITTVLVQENQAVRKGQLLCMIDDRKYVSELSQAEGLFEALRAKRDAARLDLSRAQRLFSRGAVARSRFELAQATAQDLEKRTAAAQSQLAIARLNVSRTRLTAPEDGILSFRSARKGSFVRPGDPLFGFIAERTRWVEAKLRETDLPGVKIGDEAEISFDALPHHGFKGTLESVAAASEVPFSATPNDFAAGNFSKYSQWIPVRIRLPRETETARLPIGINAHVRFKRRRA